MKTIWKFRIAIAHTQKVEMPAGASPLWAGLDPAGDPCIWAIVDPDADIQPRTAHVIGTGGSVPAEALFHLGTFVWRHNATVWHVFLGP